MKLIKHIDFTKMTGLDSTLWNVDVGEKWHNNEKQHYVNDPENILFDNGLIIRATRQGKTIRSARINTKGKFSFQYGRIEIVAKVPSGKGTWPALWMMPEESRHGRWPKSGEIDIMEHVGNEPNKLYTCLHTEKYNHRLKEQYDRTVTIDGMVSDFHTYALTWEKNRITYAVDGKTVTTYERGENGRDATHQGWPFDQPFYLIINLAIGGTLGGEVDMECFPQDFVIRDIKVYQ